MRVKFDLLNTSVNWRIVAQFFDKTTKTNWALMQRQRESKSSDWINFRFCILGSVRRKRSYDFAWSSKEQRLTRVEGAHRLQSEFPDLHQHLLKYLSKPEADVRRQLRENDKHIEESFIRDSIERIEKWSDELDRKYQASTPFDRANWTSRECVGLGDWREAHLVKETSLENSSH